MCMQRKRLWIGILLMAAVLLRSPAVPAVESDPLPAPRGTPHEQAIRLYNEGVALLREKHYAAAQEKFEQALGLDETLAEAHNNLAFSLRQQGTSNFARSLQHYNTIAPSSSNPTWRRPICIAVCYLPRWMIWPAPALTTNSSCGSIQPWPPGSNVSSLA